MSHEAQVQAVAAVESQAEQKDILVAPAGRLLLEAGAPKPEGAVESATGAPLHKATFLECPAIVPCPRRTTVVVQRARQRAQKPVLRGK